MGSFGYFRGFGLSVASELRLDGFDAAHSLSSEPDVFVRFQGSDFPCLTDSEDRFAFKVNEDACFSVRDGCEIDVWVARNADLRLTLDLLLGTAFAVLLFQRGLWPVHVSAVRVEGGVWLFSGESGEGKSTLAAWMNATWGWTILSDDAGVLSLKGGRVWFAPGARNLKLLPDALQALHGYGGLSKTAGTSDAEGKVHFRLPHLPVNDPLPVLGFVDLASTRGSSPTVVGLKGSEALQAVRSALYRPWFGRNLCQPAATLKFCADASQLMPMYRFARPRDYGRIRESNDLMAATMVRDASAGVRETFILEGSCLPD